MKLSGKTLTFLMSYISVTSVVKLYGKICQKQNIDVRQFSMDNPEYFTAICDLIQHNPDPSVKRMFP